ncbi:MAG: HDOD domain-containing protein [Verrucomicrobiota bacterium]
MNPKIEKLIFKLDSMPTLPIVYSRIKEAVDDPDTSFEDIARIILNDQGLSARLLRLANSAFYGYPSAVSSIPDALTVIGLQQFKNMALSTCIMDVFRGVPPLVNMEQFWRKSIACGLCARIMALELREANSERFFLGGLLHKIGRLIIFKELPLQSKEVLQLHEEREQHLHQLETEVLGFNHADVGGALLEYWNLPNNLIELTSYYIKPVLAKTSVQDVSLIHLADFITEALGMGFTGERYVPEFSDAAWGHSGLDENNLFYIVEELERQYEEVCKIFLDKAQ